MHELLHSGLPLMIISPLDENEAKFPLHSGALKLSFRGRETFVVREPVVITEQAKEYGTAVHFCEIDSIRSPVTSRQVLEKKDRKETAQ